MWNGLKISEILVHIIDLDENSTADLAVELTAFQILYDFILLNENSIDCFPAEKA